MQIFFNRMIKKDLCNVQMKIIVDWYLRNTN